MENISKKILYATQSLVEEIRKSSDVLYLTSLGLYILSLTSSMVAWVSFPGFSGIILKQTLTVYILFMLGIYLGSILFIWIHKRWAIFPILLMLAGFLYMCARMQRNVFDGLMVYILIICSFGRSYKKILQVTLGCIGLTVITSAIGVWIGYTRETPKVGAYGTGYAFGISHPNVWGTYALIILLLVWYLFILKKSQTVHLLYYAFSWLFGIFMVFIPKCRTEAVLVFLFPIVAIICELVAGKEDFGRRFRVYKIFFRILMWALILSPVICFVSTIILGQMREWLVVHTFGTYIENFSKRFIQSGLAFKEHGFPLFGEQIRFNSGLSEKLGGYTFVLYIMDNAYSTYAIIRGMIWLVPLLTWLCYAGWQAVKQKDYAILAIAVLFSMLGLMERYALDIYNVVLLYPLTLLTVNRYTKDYNSQQESTGKA